MAVYKRLKCQQCCKELTHSKVVKTLEPCPSCGGTMVYLDKWYVKVGMGVGKKPIIRAVGNKIEAEAEEGKLKAQKFSGELTSAPSKMKFGDLADKYLKNCLKRKEEGSISENTYISYKSRITVNIKPYFRGTPVSNITKKMITKFRDDRKDSVPLRGTDRQGMRGGSVNVEIAILYNIFAYAIEEELISFNPAQGVKGLKAGKRDTFLDVKQCNDLLEACKKGPKPLYTMVQIALNTGLRLDGVIGLRWEHILWKENILKRTVKRGKVVRIPMNQTLKDVLTDWRNSNDPPSIHGWVFPSNTVAGKCVSTVNGFDRACKEIGLPDLVFHDLRHTFATHLIKHTKDIHLVAQILGHSSTYMTERYAHLLDDHRQNAMADFEIGSKPSPVTKARKAGQNEE